MLDGLSLFIPKSQYNLEWSSQWTIFHWATWISWSPIVGSFIARISRGKTVRELIIGVILLPSLFSFAFVSIVGGITKKLDFNLMFNNCGNLNLIHGEAYIKEARMSAAMAQYHGLESKFIDSKQAKELVHALNINENIKYPIYGAIYHPPGGILRHDAVVWGLARKISKFNSHIHQQTEVTDISVKRVKLLVLILLVVILRQTLFW